MVRLRSSPEHLGNHRRDYDDPGSSGAKASDLQVRHDPATDHEAAPTLEDQANGKDGWERFSHQSLSCGMKIPYT